jgi:hypothetical protein
VPIRLLAPRSWILKAGDIERLGKNDMVKADFKLDVREKGDLIA